MWRYGGSLARGRRFVARRSIAGAHRLAARRPVEFALPAAISVRGLHGFPRQRLPGRSDRIPDRLRQDDDRHAVHPGLSAHAAVGPVHPGPGPHQQLPAAVDRRAVLQPHWTGLAAGARVLGNSGAARTLQATDWQPSSGHLDDVRGTGTDRLRGGQGRLRRRLHRSLPATRQHPVRRARRGAQGRRGHAQRFRRRDPPVDGVAARRQHPAG